MPKGPAITSEIESLIAKLVKGNPSWTAVQIRNEAGYVLQSNWAKRKHGEEPPKGWPSLSAVQKISARVRKAPADPEDLQWTTAKLDSYPIAPEILPKVLEIAKCCITNGEGFTIRQSKWAARFSAIEKAANYEDNIEILARIASSYAHLELIYQTLGHTFDCSRLDRWLLMGIPSGKVPTGKSPISVRDMEMAESEEMFILSEILGEDFGKMQDSEKKDKIEDSKKIFRNRRVSSNKEEGRK